MKSKRNSLFVFSIIAVYVLTIIAFAGVLLFKHHQGKNETNERFNTLTRDLSRNMRTNEIGSREFYDTFINSIGTVDDIYSLQLHQDGVLIFSYPADASILSENNSGSSSLLRAKTTEVSSENGSQIKLSATLYLLKPITIFISGSIAFLVILCATLVCLLYILFFLNSAQAYETEDSDDENEEIEVQVPKLTEVLSKQNEAASEKENISSVKENTAPVEINIFAAKEEPAHAEENHTLEKEAKPLPEENLTLVKESEPLPQENLTLEKESEPLPEENLTLEKEIEPLPEENISLEKESQPLPEVDAAGEKTSEPLAEEKPASENVSAPLPEEKPASEETNVLSEPVGLFSPRTGFGWESYMTPRLDKELIRAASSEQDLALFTMRIIGIDWEEPYAKKIISLIIETVKFDDLVFEYKNDGCIAILQNVDTDHSLQIADQLRKDVAALLREYNKTDEMKIGISTRSLRLISGTRLANESEQALIRAIGDKDSPIVAFRVNPEKYRNYLANNTQ